MDRIVLSDQERSDLITKVQVWALQYSTEDFNYGSPSRYFASARHEGIISNEEYEYVEYWMGSRFYYTGD